MNSYDVWNFLQNNSGVGKVCGVKMKERWYDWIIVEAGQEVHGG